MISELFAVGTEITAKEKVVEMVREKKKKDDFVPWLDNFGSLFMAASVGEE